MLKLIRLSAALCVGVIIVSFPQIVRSRPESETSKNPVVRSSQAGSLFCYMRTEQGATLNLENLCRASDGSGNGDRAASVANSPTSTTPSETASNETLRRGPVIITINGASVPSTPVSTNTSANSNPNGTNTSANGNPNGTNTSANGNPNGTNTSVNNSNFSGTNTSANSTSNGTNTSVNSNPNGTNTSANSASNGTNTSANNASNATNTSTNNASNATNTSTNNQR